MPNPTIHFRLSPYQLARGLQIVRQLEPNYQLVSISKLVKAIYLDYLAKMSYTKTDSVPQHYVDEIEALLYKPMERKITFQDIAKMKHNTKTETSNKADEPNEESIKSSVTDFSLPPEMLED